MTAIATPEHTSTDADVATLVVAFADDPIVRWIWPDAARYLTHFAELTTVMGAPGFETDNIDRAPQHAGVAVWVPPGSPVDEEALGDLLAHSVDEERQETMFAFLGQVEEYHPEQEHWYLPFIGVDPQHQGRGVGSALLRERLARVDADGLGAYLEASSARSRALYERHGFVVTAEIRAADSPPLWPMWREPGSSATS